MKLKRYTDPPAAKKKTWQELETHRTSDVAQYATQIQQQTGCDRTEALKVAERRVPHMIPV